MPAQQVAEFLLKRAGAMVLLLRLYILQHGIELARAYRKRAISALPQEPAITSINCFDPLRRYFLDLFDQLGLGKCSRQRRDDVNYSCSAHAHEIKQPSLVKEIRNPNPEIRNKTQKTYLNHRNQKRPLANSRCSAFRISHFEFLLVI